MLLKITNTNWMCVEVDHNYIFLFSTDIMKNKLFLWIQDNCNVGVANGKIRDLPRCRDPSEKSEPETLWWKDSKKVKTNHEKTRLQDLSKTFPRFRDPAKIFRDSRFPRYHSPPLNVQYIVDRSRFPGSLLSVGLDLRCLPFRECSPTFRNYRGSWTAH